MEIVMRPACVYSETLAYQFTPTYIIPTHKSCVNATHRASFTASRRLAMLTRTRAPFRRTGHGGHVTDQSRVTELCASAYARGARSRALPVSQTDLPQRHHWATERVVRGLPDTSRPSIQVSHGRYVARRLSARYCITAGESAVNLKCVFRVPLKCRRAKRRRHA